MKKISFTALLLFCCVLLCACGAGAQKQGTTDEIYKALEGAGVLPPMVGIDADEAFDFYGIDVSQCGEFTLKLSSDSMLADEVILLRAKTAEAAKALKTALDKRMQVKASEARDYSPEQYAIIQKGKVLQNGNLLALLVSPDVAKLEAVFKQYK